MHRRRHLLLDRVVIDLFFQLDRKPHFYGAAVLAVIGVLVVRGLWRGVAWLRSLLVGMIALGLAASVVMIIMRRPFVYPAWFGVQAVLQGAAAVLLLRPAARQWFASR